VDATAICNVNTDEFQEVVSVLDLLLKRVYMRGIHRGFQICGCKKSKCRSLTGAVVIISLSKLSPFSINFADYLGQDC